LVTEDLLQKYFASRIVPSFTYAAAAELKNFHSTVNSLMRLFVSLTLSKHQDAGKQMDNWADLSESETRRIQRSFYRFELFQRFFPQPRDQTDSDKWKSEAMGSSFFFSFEPWEVEEIACVHNFIYFIYAEALDTYATQLLPKDVSRNSPFRVPNIDGYMTIGLEFLHNYLNSAAPKQLELLKNNLLISFPGITMPLNRGSMHPMMYTDKFLEKDGSILNFDNDDTTGPNAGWIWANKGRYQFEFNQPRNHVKRSWGYVFWDKARLEKWGVFDVDPKEDTEGKPDTHWYMYCH